ncbi:MAG: EscU/YscU/HrcU family type III secretion system export apparatus switch protein [Sandaracinaceae bacterium]
MSAAAKRHAPTARTVRRARERGEVASSPLLRAAVVLCVVSLTVAVTLDASLHGLRELFTSLLDPARSIEPAEALAASATLAARMLAPILLAAVLAAAAVGIVEVGPLFAPRALAPDPGRLDPSRGLSALASPSRWLAHLGSLALALAIAGVALGTMREVSRPTFAHVASADPARSFAIARAVLTGVAARALPLLLLGGAIAFVFQRWRYLTSLRLTDAELARERRESEGAPEIRTKQAELQYEIRAAPSLDEALAASVLSVIGPDVAALVEWDRADGAPRLAYVARGAHVSRLRARRVPVLRDGALARGLAALRLGAPIPRRFWPVLARAIARHPASRAPTDG